MAIEVPQSVKDLSSTAQSLMSNYGSLAAGEPTIGDVLKQKVTEAYSSNQDIVKPLDEATTAYLGAPAAARAEYQDIFNPFDKEKLVSQYQGNLALPMLSLSNIAGNRFGRIDDLIGAGTRAYEASVAAAKAKAELARQAYEDAYTEWKTTEDLRQSERQLDISEYSARNSGGGGAPIINIGDQGGGGVTLRDPVTGRVYQYDGFDDPDYIADLRAWYGGGSSSGTSTSTSPSIFNSNYSFFKAPQPSPLQSLWEWP